jgi:protein-tyrosine phosphatase
VAATTAPTLMNCGRPLIVGALYPHVVDSAVDPGRHREWPGFLNARTLAGVQTSRGPIKDGRLYRSDEPRAGIEPTIAALMGDGVRTVIDLRSADEIERRPSSLATEALYVVSPLVDPRMDHLRDPSGEANLLDLYRGSVDRNGRTIADAVRRVANAAPGGVLVHCSAGKDRTGILFALLLSAVGAPDAAIIDDYTRSEGRLASYFADLLSTIEDAQRRERVATYRHATADTMSGLLDHLRRRHSGAVSYLRRHGVTDRDLHRLSQRLTA